MRQKLTNPNNAVLLQINHTRTHFTMCLLCLIPSKWVIYSPLWALHHPISTKQPTIVNSSALNSQLIGWGFSKHARGSITWAVKQLKQVNSWWSPLIFCFVWFLSNGAKNTPKDPNISWNCGGWMMGYFMILHDTFTMVYCNPQLVIIESPIWYKPSRPQAFHCIGLMV